eukprot:12794156-Prorocentrum_lima.AAC.1
MPFFSFAFDRLLAHSPRAVIGMVVSADASAVLLAVRDAGFASVEVDGKTHPLQGSSPLLLAYLTTPPRPA